MDRLQQLLGLLKESPQDSFLLFALAKEYEKRNELKKALDHYREIVEKDPDYVGVYYHLGKLYERQQQRAEALAAYEEGMNKSRQQGDQHSLAELSAAHMQLAGED
jgi:tetratricopeptide (TPR) repeat protein